MAKMKTPTLEEVKEYFKDAELIADAYSGKEINLNDYDFNTIEFGENIVLKDDVIIYHKTDKNDDKFLYEVKQGYAKILSYKERKEKTYKITGEQILEIHNNTIDQLVRNKLKNTYPSVFETKLTVGKWYWRYNKKELAVWNDGKKTYGFRHDGLYLDRFSFTDTMDVEEATEQEVTEALTKEAVRKGYNTDKPTHFNYKNGTGYLQNPSKSDFLFRDGILYLWDIKIFEDGQWAEIIPTLTIQEAEAKLNCKII